MCYRRMQLNNYIPISWDSTVYLCPTIFRVVRLKRIKRIYNFQNCHVAILISQAGSHSLDLLRILRYHPGSAGGTAGDSDGVSHFAPLCVHTHHNAILLIRREESVHFLEVELLVQSRVVYIRPDGAVHL